ncbi:hypothetical protein DAPPUDRAFT_325074 [Daphnia pulex]|uniref:DUF2828 domain-containing protein n=1 Tax=Daphnia pulex TaxID=6669 RepID=E9H3M4_DAPPU|nr:hypothetical protein DAPPUDRAFT_325074 [Daphnia pulex]|eukprot:EFX73537.1 hypothetical protein DAPPUDRAFT_325074 [Daphnia pulex]
MVVCGCVEYLMRLEVASGVVGGSVVGRSVVIGLPVVGIYLAVIVLYPWVEIFGAVTSQENEKLLPENITLTENASFTHSSTTSACLDFFFEVMQRSQSADILETLKKSWDEDPLISLKLIFQLRDIRSGKGAAIEFHHCLIWLFHNHPQTLLYNLEHIPKHGYWKDLSWFMQFLLEGHTSMTKERQKPMSTEETRIEQANVNYSLEEIIRKRVDGVVEKTTWTRYLKQLPDDESRKSAKLKFTELSKVIHLARSREAKMKKKSHDKEALEKDKCLPKTALAGKWAPAIGGSIDSVTPLGKNIARALYSMAHQRDANESDSDYDTKAYIYYRKEFLTPLRTSINVPEQTMSKKKWGELDYQRVPSICMKRNKEHFLKNDAERFNQYLEDVKSGKKSIASGALLPHEIVKHCLSVCDVSGSMCGTPMEADIALSLLTAELSKPPFNSHICSFSSKPFLQKIDQPTLAERVASVMKMHWGMSTIVQAVFDLILKLAISVKLAPSEMVKTLFIFSDMEFDQCGGRKYETDYQFIKRKFEQAGYPLPSIVFWNLRGDGKRSKPVTKDEKNVALVSGFSGQMLKTFLESGEIDSPYLAMLKSLGTTYDHLKVID